MALAGLRDKQDNKGLEQSMEYLTKKKDIHLVTTS